MGRSIGELITCKEEWPWRNANLRTLKSELECVGALEEGQRRCTCTCYPSILEEQNKIEEV